MMLTTVMIIWVPLMISITTSMAVTASMIMEGHYVPMYRKICVMLFIIHFTSISFLVMDLQLTMSWLMK